jgi:4-alpha-glucanotransferase
MLRPTRASAWFSMVDSACGLQKLKGVPIIAEDLGVITPDVHQLRESIGAPGMVVLQFAWGSGATNTHLPHNHYENSVCYPGTDLSAVPQSPFFQTHGDLPVDPAWRNE